VRTGAQPNADKERFKIVKNDVDGIEGAKEIDGRFIVGKSL